MFTIVAPVACPSLLRTAVLPAHRALLESIVLLDLMSQFDFRCQPDRSYATRARMTRTSVSRLPAVLTCLAAHVSPTPLHAIR